jgi:GPH family glycoside/pentoside/hexuronide:cation symporter
MSEERPIAASETDRVPWPQLIAYGFGGLIPIALFNIAPQLMGLLGNISLGLSPLWLGVIMAIPRLWDAFSDPIMGHISDNTRSRWGRRRPYILIGGLLVAVSFVAMWWVPRGDSVRAYIGSEDAYEWFQLSCILGAMVVFFTATTVFEIPHGALGMEMSGDYHERTRLFSAKSFLGNLFAMGTPWLFWVAGWEFFAGKGGDEADGMRYLSMVVAAVVIPMSYWWFVALREPAFEVTQRQRKSHFWDDMRKTVSNRIFLRLIAIMFTLSVGFNLVQIFNYYITIFYVYGGDTRAAGPLLGINGMVWAITGLLAVFPLNFISKRVGKNRTLIIAILLMAAAQLSKIVCYNPDLPYLALIPTVLLSAGMLMFYTLGASMVGDVCDEDELQTGTRSDGSYYSVFWWFLKLGNGLAAFGMGVLLMYTGFDGKQNTAADALLGSIETISSKAEEWKSQDVAASERAEFLGNQIDSGISNADKLGDHFEEHGKPMDDEVEAVRIALESLRERSSNLAASPDQLIDEANSILHLTVPLKQQTASTLYRLRLFEIGLPLVLCFLTMLLTFGYPLTEERCYEIKAALEQRRGQLGA